MKFKIMADGEYVYSYYPTLEAAEAEMQKLRQDTVSSVEKLEAEIESLWNFVDNLKIVEDETTLAGVN